jgi:hypothetical protein
VFDVRQWFTAGIKEAAPKLAQTAGESVYAINRNFEPVRQEAGAAHGDFHFRVSHEGVPDMLGACILGHQHADTYVNAEHVFAGPAGDWVEGVDKAYLRQVCFS